MKTIKADFGFECLLHLYQMLIFFSVSLSPGLGRWIFFLLSFRFIIDFEFGINKGKSVAIVREEVEVLLIDS